MEIPFSQLGLAGRSRKDLGNIKELAESIKRIGLLHPIVVTESGILVSGMRRVEACRMLGMDSIEARVVDVPSLLEAERDENEVRKDFTPSERKAIADAIKREIGNRHGARVDKELVGTCPQFPAGAKTRELAARKAGFGSEREYRRVAAVVNDGAPEIVEAMDRGDVTPSAAADYVRRTPRAKQAVADIPRRGRAKRVKVVAKGRMMDIVHLGKLFASLSQLSEISPSRDTRTRAIEEAEKALVVIRAFIARMKKDLE